MHYQGVQAYSICIKFCGCYFNFAASNFQYFVLINYWNSNAHKNLPSKILHPSNFPCMWRFSDFNSFWFNYVLCVIPFSACSGLVSATLGTPADVVKTRMMNQKYVNGRYMCMFVCGVCMYVCLYVYVCMCVCVYACICMCVLVYGSRGTKAGDLLV